MPVSPDYKEFVRELLAPLGAVTIKPFFGGLEAKYGDVQFAWVLSDTLYFKVDDENRQDYIDAGSGPFTYEGKSRPVEMSYYRVPDALMNDPGGIAEWAERAHQAALRSRIGQPPRRARRTENRRPGRR